tara:strand:- start:746 stop:1387 length:642 start_codon:yes stop_codon:yes gene_type:complete
MTELQNRIITSIPLLIVLYLSLTYKIVLFLTLSLITFLLFSEIYYILNKIFKQKEKLKLFLLSLFSYLYIILFVVIIWYTLNKNSENNLYLILLLSICIFSDIGGYFFGKILKGKKLTKISPKKTYSGMIGSYILPLVFCLFFFRHLDLSFSLILLVIIVSTVSQIGDLFVSYLKRKAKIKDTGNFLPGHGGLLDRLDGILFAIPIGIFLISV